MNNLRFALLHHFKRTVNAAIGSPKFVFGYSSAKYLALRRVLLTGDFYDAVSRDGYAIGLDERLVEYPWLFNRLPDGPGELLDAGSILNYDFLLDMPKIRAKKLYISTLAPERYCFWRQGVSYLYQDLRRSCFNDDFFSWIVCISTLEHVGMDNTLHYTSDPSRNEAKKDEYLVMIGELRRVLKPGGSLFLTVPFGAYDDRSWLQVFDAGMIDKTMERFAPALYEEKYFRYSARGWRISSREECRGAGFYGSLSRKGKKDPAIAAEAVACIELVR